jgi:hypothetical protein
MHVINPTQRLPHTLELAALLDSWTPIFFLVSFWDSKQREFTQEYVASCFLQTNITSVRRQVEPASAEYPLLAPALVAAVYVGKLM